MGDLGCLADIGHDDEWTTREPTGVNGVRGWYFGFKYVPWKNVEWETLYARLTENTNNSWRVPKPPIAPSCVPCWTSIFKE